MPTKIDHVAIHNEAIPTFRFLVEDSVNKDLLGVFTECTLPTIEWELEEVKEGGLNHYIHQLPGRRKAARLTLKNGLGRGKIMTWFLECLVQLFKNELHDIMAR